MVAKKTKIIVIGSGVSGMSAAISAVEGGATVTLISRTMPSRSGSACIREGINASLDGDVASHVSDTIAAGCGLADKAMVERMCGAAPDVVALLAGMGVVFDRTQGEGRLRIVRTCGSTKARTLSMGRAGGVRVVSSLAGQLLRHESHGVIAPFFGWDFLSLIIDEKGMCRGVVAQDMRNMEMRAFPSDAVILCSGGFQAIFGRHCASELNDGVAAMRVCEQGAVLSNPEFVEIFPFTLPAADKCRAVVDQTLTEGGRIQIERDGRSWHFLEEYHGDEGGCVTRSKAVRSIIRAAEEMGGDQSIRLDLTHLDPALIEARLSPFIDASSGLTESYLTEVVPSVGLTLGGIKVGADHSSTITGLYAAGSCTSAYHGAGALAGNEILSSVYGGMVAGESAAVRSASDASDEPPSSLLKKAIDAEEDLVARISAVDGRENAHAIKAELGRAMFDAISGGKDNEKLALAAGTITELEDRLRRAALLDRKEWANAELFLTRGLSSRLRLARLFIEASIAREESRGCHIKTSIEGQNDKKWKVSTTAAWEDGRPLIEHSERIEE